MIKELMQVRGQRFFCIFLFYFGKKLVRVERMGAGGLPGRFDVVLGVSFALGQLVEVPKESLTDIGASGMDVASDCSTINRL